MHDRKGDRYPILAGGLRALSWGYGAAVGLRSRLYRNGVLPIRRLPCKVVSVGNLTVGGTGKTPMALHLADLLHKAGCRTAIVSRGYGGSAGKQGAEAVGDGRRIFMEPHASGDEPFMMAARRDGIPVVVGRDRFAAGMLACRRWDVQAVVLDDGFQHLRLFRDVNLLLMDCRRPLGNGFLLPRGPLREPAGAWKRAHACLLTRWDAAEGASAFYPGFPPPGTPFFRVAYAPVLYGLPADATAPSLVPLAPDALSGRRVYAFSGIAGNAGFQHTVSALCGSMAGFSGFPDHHAYTSRELEAIGRAAAESGADTLVTTEKDWARISRRPMDRSLEMVVIGIEPDFGREAAAFGEWLFQRIGFPVKSGGRPGPAA